MAKGKKEMMEVHIKKGEEYPEREVVLLVHLPAHKPSNRMKA